MTENATSKEGKSLVIVESPAKARTISKFLSNDFTVEASVGHVRDLPEGKKQVPEKYKGEDWAYLGVNVESQFEPIYIVPPGKKQQVTKLRKLLKESDVLYLATDEDREGEAISWHLYELLQPKVPVRRLVFHEITQEAIEEALANPRQIDQGLVKAQETRRILDRLYGYDVSSKLIWKKVKPRLSAGRVQSVAVRLIVERERERIAFVSATFWDLLGQFAAEGSQFSATLSTVDGRRIPAGKDFDSSNGKLTNPDLMLLDEEAARQLSDRLKSAEFRVASLEEKPYTSRPAPPFTTSTMQQEANRKLGFSARRTMDAAQRLYQNGYITYMRTDSTNLASVAVEAARELVRSEYGQDYLPDTPRAYKSKVKNAQEAHEAIRPAGHPFRLPSSVKSELSSDDFRLFELIWKRTIASQMKDAKGRRISIRIEGNGAVFQVSGKTIDFAGFLRAYVEGSDDPDAELADKETILPQVTEGQVIDCRDLEPKGHTTQPPARFSEASLTRTLEEKGIGRPSTYASIIETIQSRDYVFKKGNALVPTWTAFAVCRILEEHFPRLVDYAFTAQMEEVLDAISRGEAQWLDYLKGFYFGDGDAGLKDLLDEKVKEIDAREMSRFLIGTPDSGESREEIYLRVGRWGPFIEQGERTAPTPNEMPPDELTVDVALKLLTESDHANTPIGVHPETDKPIFVKTGRFGTYIQMGDPESDEKPKNAALLKGMTREDVTPEVAIKLLELPRNLGVKPETEDVIEAHNGRYGPYVKCGSETRSLPAEVSPLDVTKEQALELLAQPKTRGRRSAPKEPIKVFPVSPVTEEPIKLLDGRYGPYVTDGQTNASLPKDVPPGELSFDQALELLAERAAKSPPKKKKKKSAKKTKAAKKKTTKKKSTKKKKGTKKKATKKKSSE